MRPAHRLLAAIVFAGCAPTTLETPPVDPAESYVFAIHERGPTLRVQRLDAAGPAWTVGATEDPETRVHLVVVPKARAAAAHPLVEPSRDEAVVLSTRAREELEACAARGVLTEPDTPERHLAFPPASLGAELFALEAEAWDKRPWPDSGPLAELALQLPISNPCVERRWRAESFFAESPFLRPGVVIRGVTLSEQRPSGFDVGALVALPDGAYLYRSTQVVGVARPGGALEPELTWLPAEEPPPPIEWSEAAAALLSWRISDIDDAGTSSAGESRFLVRLTAHEIEGKEDGDELGGVLLELRYGAGRLRRTRTLHAAGAEDADFVTAVDPYGEDGGFVAVGRRSLILKRHRDAPLERWDRDWRPTSIVRVGLPDAAYVIGLNDGGVWVGDPGQGPDGLRLEEAGPTFRGCRGFVREGPPAAPSLRALCSVASFFTREAGGWQQRHPWLPEGPSCRHEVRRCGRPSFGDVNAPESTLPGLDGEVWAFRRGCSYSFSFRLDEEERCAGAESWDLAALRYPSRENEANELVWWAETPDGIVATGHGGLAVRLTLESTEPLE